MIAAIDLTRFGCALLVVLHHYCALFALKPDSFLAIAGPEIALSQDWGWWSWPGWVGVELFFVISGYVIAISATGSRWPGFLKRRVLRLAPAAWICGSLTALVVMMSGAWPPGEVFGRWLTSMAFWPTLPQIDGSYWTLGIEVSFYLLVALQLNWQRDGERAVERTGLALALVSMVYWLLRLRGVLPESDRTTELLLMPYGGLFAAGIALSALRTRGVTALCGLTLVLGLGSGMIEIANQSAVFTSGFQMAPQAWLPMTIFSAGIVVIVAAGRLQRPLLKVLGEQRVAFLGLMTYPLYLIHHYVGAVLIVELLRAGVESHVAMIAAVVAMLALAAAITRFAEPRVRSVLSALITRHAPEQDTRPTASLPAG